MNNYTLEPITIVAGNFFTFEFEVFDQDRGGIANLEGYEAYCLIAPFAQNDLTIIKQSGIISNNGIFTVSINSDDTINLLGKYIYQPVLKIEDKQFRPAQGILTILPANAEIQ